MTPEIQQGKTNGHLPLDRKPETERGNGDSSFRPATSAMSKFQKPRRDKMNPKEKRECEVVERLIKTYFLIIRKNIQVLKTKQK